MRDSYYIKPIFLLVSIILIHGKDHDAPILDIDNQSSGYLGRISEHSVLVDLMPHLQIKNIESISKNILINKKNVLREMAPLFMGIPPKIHWVFQLFFLCSPAKNECHFLILKKNQSN